MALKYGWTGEDIFLIVFLFLVTYAVAVWSGVMKQKGVDKKKHKKSGVDFFLGGRTMPWYLIGVSLAASNIGTDILIASTGSVAQVGIGALAYEIGSGWSILCLGWFMGPIYLKSVLKTIPSYMEERYDLWIRIIFVIFSVAIFILSKMGVTVYSGALVFQTMKGDVRPPTPDSTMNQSSGSNGRDLWIFIPVIVVATTLYTFLGGLTSVMWADLAQFCIFLFGGLASVGYCLSFFNHRTGDLIKELRSLGLDRLTHFILPASNPDYPWPATTIGMLLHEYYYWSVDQEMAQRVISARGLGDARMGCALGTTLKVACFFISVIPGWTSRVFYEWCEQGRPEFSNWCGPNALLGDWDLENAQQANRAYLLLVIRQYPRAFKGLMIAGFLAAIMSNLSGAINSLTTILTYDIYNRFFPPNDNKKRGHSQRRLVFAGRIFVLFSAAITLVWQAGIQKIQINLFALSLTIQQHFGASIACTVLIGACWKRSNKQGALAGLLVGGSFSIIHIAFFLKFYNNCQMLRNADGTRLDYRYFMGHTANFYKFACLHFTIACCMIWGLTLVTNIFVTLLTPKPNYRKIEKYCIQWEDLIPRWVAQINPKFKKDDLDKGFIEQIRQEALFAQQQTDREIEEDRKKKQEAPNGQKNNVHNGQNQSSNSIQGQNSHNGESKSAQQRQYQNSKTRFYLYDQDPDELVNPLVDDVYLEKEERSQKRKMQYAEYMGLGAFFFTTFMFVYFR